MPAGRAGEGEGDAEKPERKKGGKGKGAAAAEEGEEVAAEEEGEVDSVTKAERLVRHTKASLTRHRAALEVAEVRALSVA